jgi:hypothetical protein
MLDLDDVFPILRQSIPFSSTDSEQSQMLELIHFHLRKRQAWHEAWNLPNLPSTPLSRICEFVCVVEAGVKLSGVLQLQPRRASRQIVVRFASDQFDLEF